MTNAELIELSLRARLALVQRPDVLRLFMRGRTARICGDYRVGSDVDSLLRIDRNGTMFFRHRDRGNPTTEPDPTPRIRDITCNNHEWGRELLLRLRAEQVLDQLASIPR